MMPAYLRAQNFEASLSYLAGSSRSYDRDARPVSGQSPDTSTWDGAAAFFASVQYHIPLVGITAREEWELRDRGAMCWGERRLFGGSEPVPQAKAVESAKGCPAYALPFFSPEDFGLLTSLLNWALWPLVFCDELRSGR